jgi:hypothetical protein
MNPALGEAGYRELGKILGPACYRYSVLITGATIVGRQLPLPQFPKAPETRDEGVSRHLNFNRGPSRRLPNRTPQDQVQKQPQRRGPNVPEGP